MYALLIGSALVPSLVLLAFFYLRDSFPEPPRVVLTTFVLGVLTVGPILAFLALHRELVGELDFDPRLVACYRAFVLAALPEELCKFAILLLYVRRSSAFDEPMDGLVYGAAASLGFATLENIIYVDAGGWAVVIARATTAVPLHATLGAVMGYYLAEAHFRTERRLSLTARAFVYPLILHGAYNTPLLLISRNPEEVSAIELQGSIAFVYLILGVLIVQSLWLNHRIRRLQMETAVAKLVEQAGDGNSKAEQTPESA